MDKGKAMNINEAHAILNQVKLGFYFSQEKIKQALYVTGDLDVRKTAQRDSRTLRTDGFESCYVRSRSLESEGIGEGFKWSMDWNSKRNSTTYRGIEK